MLTVLTTGSRDFVDHRLVASVLGLLAATSDGLHVLHGGARGSDRLVDRVVSEWGQRSGCSVEEFRADWDTHTPDCDGRCPGSRRGVNPYCSLAGFYRNQRMLDTGQPTVAVAFVSKLLSESKGTADMVKRCEGAGVPVFVFPPHLDDRVR